MLIKQRPLILLDGVVGALKKKWSDALYTAIINNVKSAYGKHKIVSAAGGKVAEDLDTFAKELAKRISEQSSTAAFANYDLYTTEEGKPPPNDSWESEPVPSERAERRWTESLDAYQKQFRRDNGNLPAPTGRDLLNHLTGQLG